MYADIASVACPSQSGSRAITSITFAAVEHRHQSRLSQCLLEAQLFLCTSGVVAPTLNSLNDTSPSLKQSELYCCFYCVSFMTSFLLLTFLTSHAGIVSSFFHSFLVHCCLCIWNLHRLRHRNKFVH